MKLQGTFQLKDNIYQFGDTSEGYDTTVYDIQSGFISELKIMSLLEFLRIGHVLKIVKPKNRVLDVGCGLGVMGYALYTNRYSVEYVGMDISLKNLNKCLMKKWGNKKPTLIHKDASKGIPFEDNTFDNILVIQVIEHMKYENAHSLLKECMRVLKPKGMMILTSENNTFTEGGGLEFHIHEFTYDGLVKIVADTGGVIVNEYGLNFAKSIRDVPDSKIKDFLVSRMAKLIAGISLPKESKYVVLDVIKETI